MTVDPDVQAARLRALAAKARFGETVAELQDRLAPSTIAHKAWSGAVEKGTTALDTALDIGSDALTIAVDRGMQATDDAVAFARRRPGVAAAAGTAAAALLLGPGLIRRVFRQKPSPPLRADVPRLTGPIPHLEKRS